MKGQRWFVADSMSTTLIGKMDEEVAVYEMNKSSQSQRTTARATRQIVSSGSSSSEEIFHQTVSYARSTYLLGWLKLRPDIHGEMVKCVLLSDTYQRELTPTMYCHRYWTLKHIPVLHELPGLHLASPRAIIILRKYFVNLGTMMLIVWQGLLFILRGHRVLWSSKDI